MKFFVEKSLNLTTYALKCTFSTAILCTFRRFFTFFSLFSASISFGWSQKQLDTVRISTKTKTAKISAVSLKEIQLLQPNDLGEIVQKIPGITVKNYGGIGGMKTVSVRGLGSTHQQIVRDGFVVPSTQTGQLDLGTIYAADLQNVELISGNFTDRLLPVSALLGANTLYIERQETQFSNRPFNLKARVAYGSFNSFDSWLSNRFVFKEKHLLSVSGNYRFSKGNYPYKFMNYSQIYSGKRANADLQEGGANAVYRYLISKKWSLFADYSYQYSDKGLPGAVILYQNASNQRLTSQNHQADFGAEVQTERFHGKLYATFRSDFLRYLDDGYLNAQGFLLSDYRQQQVLLGWVSKQQLTKIWRHEFGIEGFYAKLTGDISQNVQPNRFQLKAYYGFGPQFSWGNITAQVATQSLSDFDRKKMLVPTKIYFQPALNFETTKDFPIIGDIQIFYKRNVRVPTFNELYYNQIGNVKLIPEIGNQVQLSLRKNYQKNRFQHEYGANFYGTLEENKIVAVPTKNLFVWSIQNVGKARTLGVDASYRLTKFWTNWRFSAGVNYTFQSVENRTDRQAANFGDQLAYFPKNIGSLDLSTQWKQLGFSISSYFVGKRYVLNQNIATNKVDGYYTLDAQLFYTLKMKKAQQLTFRLMGKNLTNLSYAYVKYYVMPGANYLLVLNYEF